MPLTVDPAWLASLVDDSGSGTDGSPWDVADVQELIDADVVSTEQTTTSTGTQNNFSLSGSYTYLRCNNASALVLTGFTVAGATPTAGARFVLDNIGTSTVRIAHQDTGSTAANRVIGVSTQGQIVGAGGRIEGIYDGATGRWRLSLVDAGAPIAIAFSAGNFTGGVAMTWTVASGDQGFFAYTQRGKLLRVNFQIVTSTVGGTPDIHLQIAIPGGFVAAATTYTGGYAANNGTPEVAVIVVSSSSTVIQIQRGTLANWSASTDATHVAGVIEFEVN